MELIAFQGQGSPELSMWRKVFLTQTKIHFFPWLKSVSLNYKMIPKITRVISTSRDPQSVPSAGSSVTLEVYRIMLFLFTDLKTKLLYKSLHISPPFSLSVSLLSLLKKI